MMHAAGIHSALALRRNRKRRDEQKRARDRRLSSHSTESGLTSPRHSITSNDRKRNAPRKFSEADPGVSSIGMLHIGVVFLVMGIFLVGSGLIPDDNTKGWGQTVWWNELIASGSFLLAIGLFLLILNGIMSKREEDDLHKYVQGQLTRSRSGHRLERDVETGTLVTKSHRKYRQNLNDSEFGVVDLTPDECAKVHHSPPPSAGGVIPNGYLDQIPEEQVACDDAYTNLHTQSHEEYKCFLQGGSPARSHSPATPVDYHKATVFTYGTTNFAGGRYAVTANV